MSSSRLGATRANLADTIVIKDGNVFMVTLRDGRLPADMEHPLGLWFQDCRFLSSHELRVCGELPRLLTATDAAGNAAVHELTNPDLELEDGERLPAESAPDPHRAARGGRRRAAAEDRRAELSPRRR